jgi:hypothetical protein
MAPPSPSFTVFPNLPLELRCLIWEKTCEPRIVEVSYEDDGFSSLSSVPMALRVCKESRDTVIHSYPLCFGSIFYPPKIRFNFTLDTLYIDNKIEEDIPHFFSTLREREISSLRFLAIDGYFVGPTSQYDVAFISNMRRAVKSLTGLKELLVVLTIYRKSFRSRIISYTLIHSHVPRILRNRNSTSGRLRYVVLSMDGDVAQ